MAAHSSVLAWRIPGSGEPGGLPSMGSHRVGHDWSDLAVAWNYFEFSFVDSCIVCENDSVICFFLVILSFLFFSVFIWWLLLVKQRKMAIFFFSVSIVFGFCLFFSYCVLFSWLRSLIQCWIEVVILYVFWLCPDLRRKRLWERLEISSRKRDTKKTFHANMSSIKDRNGRNLTEAEDIK